MRSALLIASLLVALLAAPVAPGQILADSLRLPTENARALAIEAGFRVTMPPPGPVRSIAEFEPSEAVLVSYPEGMDVDYWVPLGLIAAMSEHIRVIALVENLQVQGEVAEAYAAADVEMGNAEFLPMLVDFPWIRDNGPMYAADGDHRISIIDFIYDIASDRPGDNDVPAALGGYLEVPVYAMDLVHTGGNYMTTGVGQAASTDLVLSYNKSEAHIRQQMRDYLGIEQYHLFADPQGTYIDHIDTWGKFLDVDKVMITQAEPGHPDYEALEEIAAFFASTPSPWGTPYQVFRVFAPDRQPYTNAVILNDHVYVPIEGSVLDDAALESYRQAMPGYTVLGFEGNWGSTDALHCRVKEVADTGMLSVRHRPYAGDVPYTSELTFDADIIAYSGQALLEDALHLVYRSGTAAYDTLALERVGSDSFRATLSAPSPGTEVSYYLSASDASGRTEHFPLVGPAGPRTFRVAPPVDAEDDALETTLDIDVYPNPFAGRTALTFEVAEGTDARLIVYDVLGREVAVLMDGLVEAGEHRVVFEASGLAVGTYIYRLVSGETMQTGRMTLLR